MVDVRIGTREPPDARVGREFLAHVAMQVDLQVDTGGAPRTHDDIGTYTAIGRHVAAGIGQRAITRIVVHGHTDLRVCGGEHASDLVLRVRGAGKCQCPRHGDETQQAHVFWITIFGNWIALLRARIDSRPAALRAISR